MGWASHLYQQGISTTEEFNEFKIYFFYQSLKIRFLIKLLLQPNFNKIPKKIFQ